MSAPSEAAQAPVLLTYPDARLHQPCLQVTQWDRAVVETAEAVLAALREAGAIGLTAAHIGLPLRVVVIRLQPDAPHTVYVNPAIVWASPERAVHDEGSVSMPGILEPVERAARIRVHFHDLEGAERHEEAEGFAAACLQHEIDQLEGIFWTDRLTRLRRERALRRYAKLRRAVA